LRLVDWGRYGVGYASLFGSAARGCSFRDVDIAILVEEVDIGVLGSLISDVAGLLRVREDFIDVALINRDASCFLVVEAVGNGVPIYWSLDGLDYALRLLNICRDYIHSLNVLGVVDVLLSRARQYGGSG